MSEMEKVMGALDKIQTQMSDFEKSKAAEIKVAQDGVESVKATVDGVRKQVQEMAEVVKAVNKMPQGDRELCREFGKLVVKSASEGTNADGGYLVADEISTKIKSVQNQYGLVRQIFGAEIVPMASDVLKLPVDTYEETSGNVPVPAATSENAQISESNVAQLDQVTLTAAKYGTLSHISNELLDDAFVDYLGAYLMPKLARQAAKIEDGIVFTAATYGLLKSTSIPSLVMDSGDTAFSDVTADYLSQMQDEVVDDALMDGGYILHRSNLGTLKRLKGTDGQYIWGPASASEPATLHGYPVLRGGIFPARSASAVSTGFVLFGDVRKACVVGERLQRRIVASKEFRFDYDQTSIRMTFRFAYSTNSNIGRALCRLVTAAA